LPEERCVPGVTENLIYRRRWELLVSLPPRLVRYSRGSVFLK